MPPVIDIAPLLAKNESAEYVAQQIGEACRQSGFFYISGHGIDESLQTELEKESRRFFEQSLDEKMAIAMAKGGRAWRGFFPVGDELTSGKPDIKEGLYFGSELGPGDPRVQAGLPLHGANLFPHNLPELKNVVLRYMEEMTKLGHVLMEGLALSLKLQASYFKERYTGDPLTLFRIFHYPSPSESPSDDPLWGVGEHTDYGVLTILKQDAVGGLQIKTASGWIHAPPIPNTFVCNIGDMLDRLTRGLYRSTPHRVLNTAGNSRFSFPFFFDPNFDAVIEPIDIPDSVDPASDRKERWDHQSVHEFEGTYGEYILGKVSKVFPDLQNDVL